MRVNRISKPTNLILNIFFIMVVITCIYPLLLVLSVSMSDENLLAERGYSIIPAAFSSEAYHTILGMSDTILRAYGVTFFVAIAGTILSVLTICLFAYPLSRKEFRYRKGFTIFLLITMLFHGGLVPWYIVCVQVLHITNTIYALILPSILNGFNVIIMRTFITSTIPDSLIESARIDGSGEFKTFFRIVFPLLKPGIATIAFFVSLHYWNDWWLPLMLISDEKLFNIQFVMYRVINQLNYLASMASSSSSAAIALGNLPNESARMALCIVAIGPIIFAYPYFQRYFVKGLTVGAVKG